MIPRKLILQTALALACTGWLANPGRAFAGSIVQNGSFQTGDFTGWSLTGRFQSVTNNGFFGPLPAGAPNYADLSWVFSPQVLSQTLAAVPGTSYTLSFYTGVNYGGAPPNLLSISVSFDGLNVPFAGTGSAPNLPLISGTASFDFTRYQAQVTANSAAPVLQFTYQLPNTGDAGITGISVTASSAAPEPATWAMLSVGLAAIGVMARRVIRADGREFQQDRR